MVSIDTTFRRSLAYGLDDVPFAEHGESLEGKLGQLKDLLSLHGQQEVLIKVMPNLASARVGATQLRNILGADYIVSVDTRGFIYARERRLTEPPRKDKKLRLDKSRWMTIPETMATLGLTRMWVHKLTERHQLTRHKFGARVLYRRSQVEQLAASRAEDKKQIRLSRNQFGDPDA